MSSSKRVLANSYGGWYIVGVEAEKVINTPTNLCGIKLLDYPDPLSKVRDVAKAHISPIPAMRPQEEETNFSLTFSLGTLFNSG